VIFFGVHLRGLDILDCFESTRRGGMAGPSDANGGGQLNAVLLVVQRSLSLGVHGDNPGWPGYLELEVGIVGDGHELDIT
jgi:hypothetical protein